MPTALEIQNDRCGRTFEVFSLFHSVVYMYVYMHFGACFLSCCFPTVGPTSSAESDEKRPQEVEAPGIWTFTSEGEAAKPVLRTCLKWCAMKGRQMLGECRREGAFHVLSRTQFFVCKQEQQQQNCKACKPPSWCAYDILDVSVAVHYKAHIACAPELLLGEASCWISAVTGFRSTSASATWLLFMESLYHSEVHWVHCGEVFWKHGIDCGT